MPIYYVICEIVPNPQMYSVYRIIEVLQCTLEDVLSGRVNVVKYRESGNYNVTGYMFLREPDNPFREQAKP